MTALTAYDGHQAKILNINTALRKNVNKIVAKIFKLEICKNMQNILLKNA